MRTMGLRFRRIFRRMYPTLARRRRWVALAVYAGLSVGAFTLAYFLRFAAAIPPERVTTISLGLVLLLPIRLVCHVVFGVTTSRWRYASMPDLVRLVMSVTAGTLVFLAVAWGVVGVDPRIPLGVIVLEWVLTTYFIAGAWALYRTAYEYISRDMGGGDRRRVIILGAGSGGETLLRELRKSGAGRFEPVGFLDDDPLKQGASISGIEILGTIDDLPEVAERLAVHEILVAMPSAGPRVMRRVVDACQASGRPHRVLPGIGEVLRGTVSLDQLREIRLEDLLGREPIELELPELADDLGGEVVLVTGAAGSIGSELSRQIALHGPRRLILLDQAESPLYLVERELTAEHPDVEVVSMIGDVRDVDDVSGAFAHLPSRVFHAAAYKHVPLMESNVRKAIENNVLGTRNVIDACAEQGVAKFVLVSTDKAVQPSSVMGATKRVAELLLLEAAREHPSVGWYAVRFGNVLGSAGSVIPLFKRQLRAGRPITVTHHEVTRYFMTIPEAVQLVLQASVLPEARGRIAMLDMGDPVRIMDLARDLIRLAGRVEGVDAEIQVTGLRPGEKLHEELTAPHETALDTEVGRISVLLGEFAPMEDPVETLCPGGRGGLARCREEALRERLMGLARASHATLDAPMPTPASA